MPNLKSSIISKIFDAIAMSRYTDHDFSFEFSDSGRKLAVISFKHGGDYSFTILEETVTNYTEYTDKISSILGQTKKQRDSYTGIFITERPGEYKSTEKKEVTNIDEAIGEISKWCDNIHEDICVQTDKEDPFSSIRENLEKILSENIENENEIFNSKEMETLSKKLDELYKKFEELQEKNVVTEHELSRLKEQLSTAKKNALNYPKGFWARTTNNKLLQTINSFAKSKEGRELIFDGFKKFFLE